MNVLNKTFSTWNLCWYGIFDPMFIYCVLRSALIFSINGIGIYRSLASCVRLWRWLFGCGLNLDWVWNNFEGQCMITKWFIFSNGNFSSIYMYQILCILMQCIMINAYIILSLGNNLPQRFDAFYHLKSKIDIRRFREFSLIEKMLHQWKIESDG